MVNDSQGFREAIRKNVVDVFAEDHKYEHVLDFEQDGDVTYIAVRDGDFVSAYILYQLNNDDSWDYKEYSEGAMVFAETCPVRILDLLTETDNEAVNAWRQKCRSFAKRNDLRGRKS